MLLKDLYRNHKIHRVTPNRIVDAVQEMYKEMVGTFDAAAGVPMAMVAGVMSGVGEITGLDPTSQALLNTGGTSRSQRRGRILLTGCNSSRDTRNSRLDTSSNLDMKLSLREKSRGEPNQELREAVNPFLRFSVRRRISAPPCMQNLSVTRTARSR
jgi:hypothetical protein